MTATRRPLRIVFVTAALDPGGSERQLVELAARLPKDRFACEFVLLTERGDGADVVEAAGVRVRALGSSYRLTTPFPIYMVRVLTKVLRFMHWMRNGHYDIADAWLYHAYALTAVTKPLLGIPLLISGRRSLSDYKEHFGLFETALDKIATRQSDAFVANAYAVRDDVAQREGIDPARIEVVRNGVLLPEPMPLEERRAWRARWGWGDEHVVAGCIASVKPGKGFELLIDVAERLRTTEPRLRYVIIGDGVSRKDLEADVARRGLDDLVRFHGIEPDARKLYGALDIGVQASESEGLPNAVLEPAAAGIAVLATAAGGTPEIVTDGQNGLLVPIKDPDAMAAALVRLAADPELRATLGAAARASVADTFAMDRMVEGMARIYEELAAQRLRDRKRRPWRRASSDGSAG